MGKAKHFIQAKTLEKIHTLTRMKTTKKKSRKSNPLPFYIPFFTKKVPLSYTFYLLQMVPLPHTLFRTLYPF